MSNNISHQGDLSNPPMGLFFVQNLAMVEKQKIISDLALKLTHLMSVTEGLRTIDQVSKKSGIGRGTVDRIKKGEVVTGIDNVAALAKAFGISTTEMLSPSDPFSNTLKNRRLNEEVDEINYYAAKGSCGGGFHNDITYPKGQLVKEIGFFKKYHVKPENLAAIYADGNSMADFIVDGDMVIFDKTQTMPQSGKIFAIEHPDGLRIKQLRREIDGTWVLESRNQDKRSFPDERITPEHAELLKIFGQFVYRQGG